MRSLIVVLAVMFGGCSSLIPGIMGPSCAVDSAGGCSCTSGGTANSFQCDEGSISNTVCCATTGWPNSGSCACDPSTTLPSCTQHADGGCECFAGNSADAGDTTVTSCQPGVGVACCTDTNQHCVCNAACMTASTQVANCGTTPTADCGSKVHLMSCSQ